LGLFRAPWQTERALLDNGPRLQTGHGEGNTDIAAVGRIGGARRIALTWGLTGWGKASKPSSGPTTRGR